jgi:5-formyltetrahydrofolate cyclo-ligase
MRSKFKRRLEQLSVDDVTEKSRLICNHLIDTPQYIRASVVMAYLSMPQEVDTTDMVLHAWKQGKTVAAPRVEWQDRHMQPVEITSLETGFDVDVSGLRNPLTSVPMPLEDIDIIIAPGLVFDSAGGRLGRGGGYYDRLLSSPELRACIFGVGFGDQVIEVVPMETHDKRMRYIVTEEGVMDCGE